MGVFHKIKEQLMIRAECFLVGIGLLLRFKHLLENRPLWLDEACPAVSIAGRSWGEIVRHYEIMPEFARPPMLFMMAEKFFISIFGNHEFALRAFPFLCGIAALMVFAFFAKRFLERPVFLLALAFFALVEPLVYYSAELKQYSTDILCAVLIIGFVSSRIAAPFTVKRMILWGVGGAFILWFSNAMVFVLAGVGAVVCVEKVFRRQWCEFIRFLGSAGFWLINFALIYGLSLSQMIGNSSLKDTWPGAFRTAPVFSMETLVWAWRVISMSFGNPAGLSWVWLMLPLFCWGLFLLFRHNRTLALLLILPFLFTFMAAFVGKYPFHGRVILFLVGGYFIFIAQGAVDLYQRLRRVNPGIAFSFLILILVQPVADAGQHLLRARSNVDNRGMMEFFSTHYEPGDFIYMNTSAQPPFWYYVGKTGVAAFFPQPVVGAYQGKLLEAFRLAKFARYLGEEANRKFVAFRNEYNVYNAQGMFRANMGLSNDQSRVGVVYSDRVFEYPSTGRTWVILSGAESDDQEMNALIRDSFDKRGKRLLAFEGLNAAAYLFEIR